MKLTKSPKIIMYIIHRLIILIINEFPSRLSSSNISDKALAIFSYLPNYGGLSTYPDSLIIFSEL